MTSTTHNKKFSLIFASDLRMKSIWKHIKDWVKRHPRGVKIATKVALTPMFIILLLFVVTSVSAVYDFGEPKPFSGDAIYNPYADIDTTYGWKRANLHTHSRVEGIFNECDETPKQICDEYAKYGYEIVQISNHNEITPHPYGDDKWVSLYEHGFNLLKFHINVYGSKETTLFDHALPIFDFQRQFQIDMLADDAIMVQFNHPQRVPGVDKKSMERIGGYRLIELSRVIEHENREWDWALSAGHYSFGLHNDDLHNFKKSKNVAIRSTVLNTPSTSGEDITKTLYDGRFYALYTPDFGDGDMATKIEKNLTIPYVRNIGMTGDTIYISFTERADSIRFTGQDQRLLHSAYNCDTASYAMRAEDSYARITAYFADGERIYSNPFARYDAETMDSPFENRDHSVNIPLTIVFNLVLLALVVGLGLAMYKVYFKW